MSRRHIPDGDKDVSAATPLRLTKAVAPCGIGQYVMSSLPESALLQGRE